MCIQFPIFLFFSSTDVTTDNDFFCTGAPPQQRSQSSTLNERETLREHSDKNATNPPHPDIVHSNKQYVRNARLGSGVTNPLNDEETRYWGYVDHTNDDDYENPIYGHTQDPDDLGDHWNGTVHTDPFGTITVVATTSGPASTGPVSTGTIEAGVDASSVTQLLVSPDNADSQLRSLADYAISHPTSGLEGHDYGAAINAGAQAKEVVSVVVTPGLGETARDHFGPGVAGTVLGFLGDVHDVVVGSGTPLKIVTYSDGSKAYLLGGPSSGQLFLQGIGLSPVLKIGNKAFFAKPVKVVPKTLKEVNLKGIIQGFGKTLRKEGEFFGWGPRSVSKSIRDFTKKQLLDRGWTKARLEKVARAYDDIARITPNNPSATGRASQLRDIISEFFP